MKTFTINQALEIMKSSREDREERIQMIREAHSRAVIRHTLEELAESDENEQPSNGQESEKTPDLFGLLNLEN